MLHGPCGCIHSDPAKCAAIRFDAALSMIGCLTASCKCGCHVNHDGSAVEHRAWLAERRQDLQRTKRRGVR